MSSKSFRHFCIGLTALILPFAGFAHEESSPLGVSVTATDYHIITCEDDGNGAPAYLLFELVAGAPATGPVVSAQVLVPEQKIIVNVTDPVAGNLEASRPVEIPAGRGPYQVIVSKSGAGKAFYTLIYHCETVNNIHTGTERTYSQNQ